MPPVVLSHLRGLPAICCRDFQDVPRMCVARGAGEETMRRVGRYFHQFYASECRHHVVCLFQNYVCAKDLRPVCGSRCLSLSLSLSHTHSLSIYMSPSASGLCVWLMVLAVGSCSTFLGYACKIAVLGQQRMRKCSLALGPAWGLQIAFKLIANGA